VIGKHTVGHLREDSETSSLNLGKGEKETKETRQRKKRVIMMMTMMGSLRKVRPPRNRIEISGKS
jgi:hypothetical protein